jgi:hypothetical protein
VTTITSVVKFIACCSVTVELNVNPDSIKVVFLLTIAFNVNGAAVYKNGVLLLPIFLF